jgi:hypothetical protein
MPSIPLPVQSILTAVTSISAIKVLYHHTSADTPGFGFHEILICGKDGVPDSYERGFSAGTLSQLSSILSSFPGEATLLPADNHDEAQFVLVLALADEDS